MLSDDREKKFFLSLFSSLLFMGNNTKVAIFESSFIIVRSSFFFEYTFLIIVRSDFIVLDIRKVFESSRVIATEILHTRRFA